MVKLKNKIMNLKLIAFFLSAFMMFSIILCIYNLCTTNDIVELIVSLVTLSFSVPALLLFLKDFLKDD